jgi:pimeloyl-ACP methyl ester carboxylesterase
MTSTLAVDDLALEAAWVGPPASGGPTLVFLHEGLGSITQWRDFPGAVADAARLPGLVYARQGHGRSTPVTVPRPLTYMHDEARRLPAVLAAAGIRDPILVGHSDGASIALIAAGLGVVAPRALVLIAPHVLVEDISVTSIARAAEAYRDGDLRARLARHHQDVDGAFWGWNRAWLDPGFRAWNLEALLPAITAPVLLVQGEADEYGTARQLEAITAGVRGPVTRLDVPGAGHAPFRDAPALVISQIARFAASAASGAPGPSAPSGPGPTAGPGPMR